VKATTEKAFEAFIEETMAQGGWVVGDKRQWDQQNGLFRSTVFEFIQATQRPLWDQMAALHGADWEPKLVQALVKERELKGTLHVLRHGFKFYGKTFRLAYYEPAHTLVGETWHQFGANTLHVTRQIPCHPHDTKTVDMVLSVNGIPVATLELKNPTTGQTWRDAVVQYKTDRDPRAPLFQFKAGAVVHFAVDPDEVHMTTRLQGARTFFLPFNRGNKPEEVDCGAGNPAHPSGHRTAYLWEEIFERSTFLDILGHLAFVETTEQTIHDGPHGRQKVTKETLVFPRFHQWQAVRRLVEAAKAEGPGHQYLIQHSAGSGKTNSISWLSHRLSSLHNTANQKVFDCVIVITDRRVLDKQLQDAIYQIEHAQGVVKAIDQNSQQLASALVDGTQIVITTLQKFPFILRGLLHIAGAEDPDHADDQSQDRAKAWQDLIASRRYAVIVDEAHSSQTGETAMELKRILGAGMDWPADDAETDWEEGLNRVLESRGRQKNLSFFAFTATPKGKTLELFGREGPDGRPKAFHTYSMKQAIEEGFILDVLKNYTTYSSYFGLVKAVEDDPAMAKKKAEKKLGKFLALHPYNIEQKTEIVVEHFRDHVASRLGGRAKAMVITGSRLHAVRYMKAFQAYIAENHYTDVRPLVAFSGTVKDPDTEQEYTEPGMNIDVISGKPIAEAQLPERFDSSDYQVLLVANKYQTGFDQPLLYAMYIDKQLSGVQAVQTLSRLNRMFPGKEAPFVLDFVNEPEEIREAFQPYYYVTTLAKPSDPDHLEKLKHELDQAQVYLWHEVLEFAQIFYLPAEKQAARDHARMEAAIQPAVDRYKALEPDLQERFFGSLSAYVDYYSFVSQILPYHDRDLELLASFGRYLAAHLPLPGAVGPANPEKDVALQFYRLEQTTSGQVVLEGGQSFGVKSPTAVGGGFDHDEQKPLSEIISAVNERFGTQFTEEDRLFFEQIREKASRDDRVIQTARANPLDKFELGIKAVIQALMLQRMSENDGIVTRYVDDEKFQATVLPLLAREIYRSIVGSPS